MKLNRYKEIRCQINISEYYLKCKIKERKLKVLPKKKTAVSRYPFVQSEKFFGVRYNYGS